MGGRPTKYREENAGLAYRLALLGLTDEELAKVFEIDPVTLYRWDTAHPEFRKARARGKLPADAAVAERTYQRALGYSHDAVKIFMPAGADEPVYAPYTEYYPPDTQAATWWLKNRQPALWKDRQELTGADGGPIEFAAVLLAARSRRDAAIEGSVIEGEAQDVDAAPQQSRPALPDTK